MAAAVLAGLLLPALAAGFALGLALGRLLRAARTPVPCRHTALELAAAIPLSGRVAWLAALSKAWGMDGSAPELKARSWN